MSIISQKLNTIIKKNYDAVEGYEHALKHVESPKLKVVFSTSKADRERYHEILVDQLYADRSQAPEKGTTEGAIHRLLLDVKSTLSDEEQQAVLEECIRGEKELSEEYVDLLEYNELPTALRQVLNKQHNEIEETIDELNKLHEIGEHGHAATVQNKILDPGT